MKIFITGGSGFIGSHLVPKLLTRKHKLLLLSRKRSGRVGKSPSSIKGDLKNINGWKNKLKKFRPDAVIHLAWEGLENYDFPLA